MKQLFLFVCLLISYTSFGQKHSISIHHKPGYTFIGNQNQIINFSWYGSRSGMNTFNNTINLLYNYQSTSKLSFSTGIEYAEQGQNVGLVYRGGTRTTLEAELNYLRIPVILSYDCISTSEYKLIFYSGVNFGFTVKKEDNYQDIFLADVLISPVNDRYKSTDWAIPLGITYQKNISKIFFANFGAEYLLGLTDVSKFGIFSMLNHSRSGRATINFGFGIRL
jgi:hypothetical protein